LKSRQGRFARIIAINLKIGLITPSMGNQGNSPRNWRALTVCARTLIVSNSNTKWSKKLDRHRRARHFPQVNPRGFSKPASGMTLGRILRGGCAAGNEYRMQILTAGLF